MNASQYAGTVIVPTLSRLVLCAAFFTAGWAKVFHDTTFDPNEVQTLNELGVQVKQSMAMHFNEPGVIAATLKFQLPTQDADPPAGENPDDEAEAQTPPIDTATDEEIAPTTPTAPPITTPTTVADSETFEARALYKVAIHLKNSGWQYATYLAWAAALTELIGGALLLIGLFSRVWGLGLAITMALAFHTTTMTTFLGAPFGIAEASYDGFVTFHQVYVQLALFVLAFGIFITGPGPLSLDRAIFRRSGPDEVEIDVDDMN